MSVTRAGEVAVKALWLVAHWKLVVVALVIVAIGFFSLLTVAAISNDSRAAQNVNNACVPPAVDSPVVVDAPADVRAEQIQHAQTIDQVAQGLGLSGKASRIGIITAMGESSLVNIDYGDVAGPDSRGLFQQRTTMGWGTESQVMNPEFAATSFFTGRGGNKGLTEVAGWERMDATQAIHAVQRNADPYHYAKFYDAADAIITEAGIDVDRASDGSGDSAAAPDTVQAGNQPECENGAVIGDLGSGDWTHPLPGGRLSSQYGPRACPLSAAMCAQFPDLTTHRGLDFSTGGGGTVVAPADFKITVAEAESTSPEGSTYGWWIRGVQVEEPHLVFEFHHCAPDSLRVLAGDTVSVGTPLCTEGNTGNSAAPHLHFQINEPGSPTTGYAGDHAVDPYPLLVQKGIDL